MPQRFLRPGIRTSKHWNRCDWPSQSLYARLITMVDDHGRYEADPELIRSEAFPYGDPAGEYLQVSAVASMLRTLAGNEMLLLYETGGKHYLQLLRWEERVRSESKFPSPVREQLPASADKCLPPKPSSPSTPTPSPSPPPVAASKEGKGSSDFAEAKLFFNKLFDRTRHWTYEEDHLLSETLPISQDDYDLLNWAYSLERDGDGWAIDDEERRVMRTKESLIQLLREFPSELDKCRSARKKCAGPEPEIENDGWEGGYREAAIEEFGKEVVLPARFRELPGDLRRRVMDRRKKMGAGLNGG